MFTELFCMLYYLTCILIWGFKRKRYSYLTGIVPGNLSRFYAKDEKDREESGRLISHPVESNAFCKSTQTPNSCPTQTLISLYQVILYHHEEIPLTNNLKEKKGCFGAGLQSVQFKDTWSHMLVQNTVMVGTSGRLWRAVHFMAEKK